ncbi:AAA family ATPase [Nocardioides panaciterrulae]|uniref:Class 3 adenylate cyclase/tetratricopeptide (TPR) repeat protein n=1 Tax=Nocardioides panaciterrulae TaxID=661492 RepID=A0A7Y9E4A3_9ACTN|nr:AAA family ATPase [Nocardioides panaciterrulae]NYD40784.1 class 3 adenylate cyclase/tetratricopeptide (TPR) repeat protein [Nocardioides panaciterrulae]
MSQLLPGDNPQAYLPGDRRRALARGEDLPRRAHGAAVFVDISGFTPLTEALARELGGRRGAEELAATLHRLFGELVEHLHRWRGAIVYFSGDAVTAWLDGDDGSRATACALQMQEVMSRIGTVTTPAGVVTRLGVKVAVAVGEVHRFVVGDPRVQLIDVLAGRLMDSLAAAEQASRSGEVVLDAGALDALSGRVVLREQRAGTEGPVGVVAGLTDPPPAPASPPEWPRLPVETARRWLLPPVWERMVAGRGEFLADLRPAVPVFVHFGGLDFEGDPGAPATLDALVTGAQRALDALGGCVLQLTIGDKGAYLYAVFGAPVAHEDDAVRACEGALALLEVAAALPVTDVRVGVATGRLRSGTYGHIERRTFCCLGDAVNLAARLMGRAPAGRVWVHAEVAEATGERFAWEELAPIAVKGREQQVRVRALLGRTRHRRSVGRAGALGPMIGRDDELGRLRDRWRAAASGRGQVVVVQGEAGTGKSRLVAELTVALGAAGVTVAVGEASPLATQTSYAGWRGLWQDLLGLEPDGTDPGGTDPGGTDPDGTDPGAVATAVARLDPGLVARAPLLGPVLGLSLPDSELTAAFGEELRKTSLADLLGRLLAARASTGPLLLVLEDAHWLDPLSRELLDSLGRAAARLPVLLVVASRPDDALLAGLPLERAEHVAALVLASLDAAASASLVAERHRALTGRDAEPELVDRVVGRAEGNPFYLEQLVDYVLARAADADGALDVEALELPPSLHTLVLSRIDAQPEGARRAVKVASVIGRTFRTALVGAAYPELGTEDRVDGDLLAVAATRLIDLEDPDVRAFAFGHAVTRDVAYDSLPLSIRTVLHGRVADALEGEPDGPRRHLSLLAHHYALSDDLPKKRHYLLAAAAAARAVYANEAAIAHLEQVLPLVGPDERGQVLLELAESLEVTGDWAGAETRVALARDAAEQVGDRAGAARARTARAELARKQGRYAEAEAELTAADSAFTAAGDDAGRARVLHLRGTLESQQGRPDRARAAYEASLVLRERLGDEAGVAALLTNLALVAEDEGDLEAAERLGQEGLARRRALDDRRAVSVSLTDMGMLATARGDLAQARERFLEAQALAEEVGDPWVVAVGRHNLGNTARDLGDLVEAGSHFAPVLRAYAEHDDRWSLAHLFEDVALWLLAQGADRDADAVALLAAAGRLREEIGAPRFPPTRAALEAALAPAQARTPGEVLDRAEAEGRGAGLADVVRLADRVLAAAPGGAGPARER